MSTASLYSTMTDVLLVCLMLQVFALVGTIALLTVPIVPGELRFWHLLRIQQTRKWITRRRNVIQPLLREKTLKIARDNLRWHLILTFLFCGLTGRAVMADNILLRLLASVLLIPSIAYLGGSLVQRQKIAILRCRATSGLVQER
jgi:hypothetical protein